MVCSFCGSEINEGDKFCMVCGTAVQAANEAAEAAAGAAPAPVSEAVPAEASSEPAASEIQMPEVQAPDIPEVTIGEQPQVAGTMDPAAAQAPVTPEATVQKAGAYFADQQNAPAPEPAPTPAPAPTPVYAQTAEGQPVYGQPVYGQPVYAQPQPQPVVGQPVYAQPVYAQPQPQPVEGQPVYAQPMYSQPVVAPVVNTGNTTPNLVYGIVSLCLSLTFWLSIGGIVLGAIGLAKSNETLATYGTIDTKGKIGRHLSRAGLISGIVMGVILIIAIFAYLAEEVW